MTLNEAQAYIKANAADHLGKMYHLGEAVDFAKENMPHGTFLPWLALEVPSLSYRTLHRYRLFYLKNKNAIPTSDDSMFPKPKEKKPRLSIKERHGQKEKEKKESEERRDAARDAVKITQKLVHRIKTKEVQEDLTDLLAKLMKCLPPTWIEGI